MINSKYAFFSIFYRKNIDCAIVQKYLVFILLTTQSM